jgi:hypothetical protein
MRWNGWRHVPSLFWGAGGYANIWHQAPWANREDLYIWKDDFSLVKGSHEWKFGGLFSHNFKDEPGVGAGGGNQQLQFRVAASRPVTALPTCCSKTQFFLTTPKSQPHEIADGRWRDFEFYANDTWKFHPRVTLTMGLPLFGVPAGMGDDNRISNFFPACTTEDFNTGLVTAEEAVPDGIEPSR